MKIVAIMGSHRNGRHTQKALDYFLDQLEDEHDITIYNVNKISVKPCIACDYCIDHQGECVIKDDDMKAIYGSLESCDLLVIASPVYFSAFPSKIKALIDRTQVLYNLKDRSVIKDKKLVVIALGGAPRYGKQFEGIVNTLEFYKRYYNCHELGFVGFSHTDVVSVLENEEALKELKCLAKMVKETH